MSSDANSADVIVVGAGLAGMVATRKLREEGIDVLLLEANDRLGGRVKPGELPGAGITLEFGGNAFAPKFQPQIKAELERYGIEVVSGAEAKGFSIWEDGRLVQGASPIPLEEIADIERALHLFRTDCERISFDLPFDEQDLADLDISIEEYLKKLELAPSTEDFLKTWVIHCNCSGAEEISALHMMRWFTAFDSGVWNYYAEAHAKWKHGGEYLEKIAADLGDAVRTETPVTAISQDDAGVTVTTRSGETFSAASAIVAVPLNLWSEISFDPPLSDGKAAAASEGQVGGGEKIYARVRNGVPAVFGASYPAGVGVSLEYGELEDGTRLLVLFLDRKRVDASDPAAVQEALRSFMPEVEVVEVGNPAWCEEEWARGALVGYAPGQLTRFDSALRTPEVRVLFATSDISQRWAGWLEGAVEQGNRAAAEASALRSATAA